MFRDIVGLTPDQGRPPEPTQADHDTAALREAMEHTAIALDCVGSTEIYEAHEILSPLLDRVEERLHQMIQARRPWEPGHQNVVEYLNNQPFQGTLV